MTAQPKVQARPRRWLTPITLALLEEENSHGYELMKRMEEEFGLEQINPGPVYRTLRQMENEGLCRSERDVPPAEEGGPPRRVYAITEAGEAYLAAWAKACKDYQKLMGEFSRVYQRRPSRSSEL